MTRLETTQALTIALQAKLIEKLEVDNERFRRQLGKLKLLEDLRHDIRMARLAGSAAYSGPQAG